MNVVDEDKASRSVSVKDFEVSKDDNAVVVEKINDKDIGSSNNDSAQVRMFSVKMTTPII
jgi:hypothetical protein